MYLGLQYIVTRLRDTTDGCDAVPLCPWYDDGIFNKYVCANEYLGINSYTNLLTTKHTITHIKKEISQVNSPLF